MFLSVVSGYLLSKASLVGRAGINLFYKEYKFLKLWWQGSLVVFGCLMLLFVIQNFLNTRFQSSYARLIHILAIIAAAIGLYFTYNDFRTSLNHRLLGERFHLGAYLFWFGWMIISLFFLSRNAKNIEYVSYAKGIDAKTPHA
jgi:hypothetical protein